MTEDNAESESNSNERPSLSDADRSTMFKGPRGNSDSDGGDSGDE